MKKDLVIASVSLFLIAAPAYASQNHKDNDNHKEENHGSVVAEEHKEKDKNETPTTQATVSLTTDLSLTPTSTPTPIQSGQPSGNENEKEHHDGKEAKTSEDCDADGSWKNHGAYVSCVAHQHFGGKAVSEAARSEIGKKSHGGKPSVTPSVSPTETPTVTPPLTSPVTELHFTIASWTDFKKAITQLFHLFHFNRHHNG